MIDSQQHNVCLRDHDYSNVHTLHEMKSDKFSIATARIFSIADTTVNTQLTVMRIESVCDWLLPCDGFHGKHALERRWHDNDDDGDDDNQNQEENADYRMVYNAVPNANTNSVQLSNVSGAHIQHKTYSTKNAKWKIL